MSETLKNRALKRQERYEVLVQGIVQGVGFRPFVFRLAREEQLAGFIGNDTDGVTIEVEGESAQIQRFLARLRLETPPLARIDAVAVRPIPAKGETAFRIVSSEVHGRVATGIPADAATCPDCLRELLDPADRRYRYPFLNCTNCGPRFTITRRIPYDRPQTSMAVFPMCPACQREYDDPLNRRFHAQPNACAVCGPHVWLTNAQGESLAAEDPVQQTIERLLAGDVMVLKGIGGFHLSVDATNEEAVERLRQRKHRYGKPLAVMVRDLDAARALCRLSAEEEKLLLTPARPIVLSRLRQGTALAPSVAPGLPWLGVFLPYAPLQHLLFADERVQALVMTSANLSEEPICIDNDEALQRLAAIADGFLLHNREILQRCDDSVAALVDGAPQIIRRARGYVPQSINLPMEAPPLLAVGGHLKSVFVLARGRFAYQSQHLGDLENLTGMEFFREALEHMMRTFEIEPTMVVHDLHPGYLSTQWAREFAAEHNLPLLAVQHHHAHMAACMAENGVTEPVIGLALDGTGYGTDGKIWGGEVLIAEFGHFQRFAHLNYVPLPGGEKAIREPWRMALGALASAGFNIEAPEIFSLVGASEQEARVVARMIVRGLNAPLTSSCGRLFDAAAAVVLGRRVVDYEAQAAIEWEGMAVDEPRSFDSGYELAITQNADEVILDAKPLWHALVNDLRAGVAKSGIAARFHAGLALGFVRAAVLAREKSAIRTVALSGGCLHNRRFAALLRMGLEAEGFTVLTHRKTSPGDGGLSYGQAACATCGGANGFA
ncbi:carbamoyltransferase HypF [Telmatobacter bradus]|uniref:carbamoyltransferase HypF n=1 Tax=Telmatobacter bradus TaxID=474953 RepID=UPI003B42DF3D